MEENQYVHNMMALKNIGKLIVERLVSIGLELLEILRKLGTKEVSLVSFEKKGWSSGFGLHSCFLYALEGVIIGETRNKIPFEKREELKRFSRDLLESFSGYKK